MFRIRFRLITLFAVMTFVAVTAGVFGLYLRAALANHIAFQQVSTKGGWIVVYSNENFVEFFATPTRPLLDCGTGVQRTYRPSGTSQDFGDADLALFNKVSGRCIINLSNTRVTPAAAEQLKRRHPHWQIEFSQFSMNVR